MHILFLGFFIIIKYALLIFENSAFCLHIITNKISRIYKYLTYCRCDVKAHLQILVPKCHLVYIVLVVSARLVIHNPTAVYDL